VSWTASFFSHLKKLSQGREDAYSRLCTKLTSTQSVTQSLTPQDVHMPGYWGRNSWGSRTETVGMVCALDSTEAHPYGLVTRATLTPSPLCCLPGSAAVQSMPH
jgi:hypothetical protein